MRINKSIATGAFIVPLLLASSALAAPPPSDIQIWSNEKELENGNHLILDADNTGGDIFLQFGNSLGESLSWDSANSRFNFSNSLNVVGNISLTGNVEMQALATVDGVDVSELGNATAALETQVNTNTTNIAGNTANIATNASNISSNDTDITALQTEQSAQAGRLTVNEGDIDDLETQQATNITNIAGNTTNIATNATDISDLEAEQVTQNTAISTNASDISDINVLIGDGDFTGANYLVFGSDLTEGLVKLDSQIKINADSISALSTTTAGLQTQITSNDADILALQNEQTTQDTAISNNTTNIATNSGDIDDIETWMESEKAEQYQVDLGSVTVREDGSDNLVNIFRGTETGANPHHYNKVVSSQSTLQDIDTEYKILIGADNKSFGKLIFSYKNDGSSADSKFDIVLKDASGTVIDQQIGVNSTSWYQDALDASSASVNSGDYLYLTIKSYTKNDRASYFGDIHLDYGEER